MTIAVCKGKYSASGSHSDLCNQLSSEGFSVLRWSDAPGSKYSVHSHPHDEFIVVLSGCIVFSINGIRYPLEAGDALSLPANTMHSAVNEADVPVSYLICTRD